MSDIFQSPSRNPQWLKLTPFVAVTAVFLLEQLTPGIRITPSLLTIALAIFALFLSPRAVFWWAVALFIPVVLTLWLIPNNGVRESVTFVALRSIAYVALAWVAVGLSRYRRDSERRTEGLLTLFDSLQAPIVVSDIDGNVKFANRVCCDLLGRSAEEIKDGNFFALFSQADHRGKSIERYLKFFENQPGWVCSITVNIQDGEREPLFPAKCLVMQWDHHQLLVTQLIN
jgi:PAS domain S-box-containing protein